MTLTTHFTVVVNYYTCIQDTEWTNLYSGLNYYPSHDLDTFTYEYISQGWCTDADTPTLYKNEATKNGDTFLLDGYLISLLGRAKFQESSGFDSMFAQRDFMRAFDNRVGQSAGAPMLNIAGQAFAPFRVINGMNAPQTGYGS